MNQLIACCGIDCEKCDARIATIANDDSLREETAKNWREMLGVAELTAESINCMGCRTNGPVFGYCMTCEIRSCVKEKGFDTCGNCTELETCQIVSNILQNVPGAKENLFAARAE